jgi:uncharacterized membrane protein (DUF106 family)
MPFNIALAILLLGIGYATFALKVQRTLTSPKKTREIQQKIKVLTKELNEMAKRNEDITEKQKELMPLLNESMKTQMKGMFVILPVFFLVYYAMLPMVFNPIAQEAFTIFSIPLAYGTLFIVGAVIFGLVLGLFVSMLDRKKAKQDQATQLGANTGPNTPSNTTNNTK